MARHSVGLDIGSRTTKLLELDARKRVVQAASFDTPYLRGAGGAAEELDYPALLQHMVASLSSHTLEDTSFGLSVASRHLGSVLVTLPPMPKKELRSAAVIEARRVMLPPPEDDAVFEALPLGERKAAGKLAQFEYFVVSCSRRAIEATMNLLRSQAISPEIVTAPFFALLQAVPQQHPAEAPIAIADIGASSLDITIARAGQPRFFRSVEFGIDDVVARLAKDLSISSEEAGRTFAEWNASKAPDDSLPQELQRAAQMLQPSLDRIQHEIRRTFIFYGDASGERVDRIFLAGGGVLLPS